jgi:hypothetical protein
MMNRRTISVFVVIIVVGGIIGVLAWYYTTPAPFRMQVISRPANALGTEVNIMSIVGQKCVFLVVVEDKEGLQGGVGLGEAVNISATGLIGMTDITVYPQSIIPGQVAEVTVIPNVASMNASMSITISGERRELTQTKTVIIEVLPGEDDLNQKASEMRNLFIPWLADNHPEFGITNHTEWTDTIVNPRILVVMHYIFYSDDWEM